MILICPFCRCPVLHFEQGVYAPDRAEPARGDHPWAHELCLQEECE